MASPERVSRPLSARESQIVAWLEEERPRLVTAMDLVKTFHLSSRVASDVLRRMAAKGWLARVAQGAYEPLLAESGGIAVPNPWAALASWKVPHYVGYASAAYELGLTPDRPGAVQVCVRSGTYRPARFTDLPLTLIPQRHFFLEGTDEREVGRQVARIASAPRVLVDSAATPARVGGVIALGRIVFRATGAVEWEEVVELAKRHPRGKPASRRLAALLTILDKEVPPALAEFAASNPPGHPMLLDNRSIYGRSGDLLDRWRVLANVPAEAIREEVRR
jgi:predicted transcriptional regulator of viral defense system